MLDKVHILVQAGDGGNGTTSFENRSDKKFVPSGGDGGNGARIIVRVSENAPPLEEYQFKQHWIAEAGGNGGPNHKRGRNATDLVLLVPEGTRLYDRQRNLLIRDNMQKGEEFILLEGGRGGKGNSIGKESTPGQKGAQIDLEISTRILTDLFLVGLPNSGKSMLLNRLTRSHVPTEIYPYSTREPRFGVYKVSDYESLKLCEMPSVARGASEGKGLGSYFLHHLAGAKRVLLVLDPVSHFAGSLSEGLQILRDEMAAVLPSAAELPQAVIVNKMDLDEARAKVEEEGFKADVPVFFLSAQTGEGIAELSAFLNKIYQQMDKAV